MFNYFSNSITHDEILPVISYSQYSRIGSFRLGIFYLKTAYKLSENRVEKLSIH